MAQYIVALTGGIGSGKSTVASAFASFGVPIVDSDVIARKIVQPKSFAFQAIIQRFGTSILRTDGSLDRVALRAHIFSHPIEKTWLNSLLHPLIQQKTEQQLHFINAPYVLWVVPLLIENNLQQRVNRVMVVDVDRNIQIARTLIRDGINHEQIEKILAAQVSRELRLNFADDIIDNNGSMGKLINNVADLHQHYISITGSTI